MTHGRTFHPGAYNSAAADRVDAGAAVGKHVLTESLASVQHALTTGPGPGPATHAAAAHGTSGSAVALPHGATIQQLFGRHDVSSVRAYVGGNAAEGAAAMGARAFATGDQVAFAGSPDLHTAAHEAAHVVQQRGGVQLKGGVGQAGDAYEQHADAVADLVVQGKSAEGLLDAYAGGRAAAAPGIQHILVDLHGNEMTWSDVQSSTHAAKMDFVTQVIRSLFQADEAYRLIQVLQLLQSSPHVSLDTAIVPLDQVHRLPGQDDPMQEEIKQTEPEPEPEKPMEEEPKPVELAKPEVKFKQRTRKHNNARVRTENDMEEQESIQRPPTKEKKIAPSEKYAVQDSAFELWLQKNHAAQVKAWADYEVLGISDHIADPNCQRVVVHLARNNQGRGVMRQALELCDIGLGWQDIRGLAESGIANLGGYAGDQATAQRHLALFGGAPMARYGKAAIAAFLVGDVGKAQHYFEGVGLQPNGSVRGSHTATLWNEAMADYQYVRESAKPLWEVDLATGKVTQYQYQGQRGGWHLKTVFQSLKTGNTLIDLATEQALRQGKLKVGQWSIDTVLPNGKTVTVSFNGNAVEHIT